MIFTNSLKKICFCVCVCAVKKKQNEKFPVMNSQLFNHINKYFGICETGSNAFRTLSSPLPITTIHEKMPLPPQSPNDFEQFDQLFNQEEQDEEGNSIYSMANDDNSSVSSKFTSSSIATGKSTMSRSTSFTGNTISKFTMTTSQAASIPKNEIAYYFANGISIFKCLIDNDSPKLTYFGIWSRYMRDYEKFGLNYSDLCQITPVLHRKLSLVFNSDLIPLKIPTSSSSSSSFLMETDRNGIMTLELPVIINKTAYNFKFLPNESKQFDYVNCMKFFKKDVTLEELIDAGSDLTRTIILSNPDAFTTRHKKPDGEIFEEMTDLILKTVTHYVFYFMIPSLYATIACLPAEALSSDKRTTSNVVLLHHLNFIKCAQRSLPNQTAQDMFAEVKSSLFDHMLLEWRFHFPEVVIADTHTHVLLYHKVLQMMTQWCSEFKFGGLFLKMLYGKGVGVNYAYPGKMLRFPESPKLLFCTLCGTRPLEFISKSHMSLLMQEKRFQKKFSEAITLNQVSPFVNVPIPSSGECLSKRTISTVLEVMQSMFDISHKPGFYTSSSNSTTNQQLTCKFCEYNQVRMGFHNTSDMYKVTAHFEIIAHESIPNQYLIKQNKKLYVGSISSIPENIINMIDVLVHSSIEESSAFTALDFDVKEALQVMEKKHMMDQPNAPSMFDYTYIQYPFAKTRTQQNSRMFNLNKFLIFINPTDQVSHMKFVNAVYGESYNVDESSFVLCNAPRIGLSNIKYFKHPYTSSPSVSSINSTFSTSIEFTMGKLGNGMNIFNPQVQKKHQSNERKRSATMDIEKIRKSFCLKLGEQSQAVTGLDETDVYFESAANRKLFVQTKKKLQDDILKLVKGSCYYDFKSAKNVNPFKNQTTTTTNDDYNQDEEFIGCYVDQEEVFLSTKAILYSDIVKPIKKQKQTLGGEGEGSSSSSSLLPRQVQTPHVPHSISCKLKTRACIVCLVAGRQMHSLGDYPIRLDIEIPEDQKTLAVMKYTCTKNNCNETHSLNKISLEKFKSVRSYCNTLTMMLTMPESIFEKQLQQQQSQSQSQSQSQIILSSPTNSVHSSSSSSISSLSLTNSKNNNNNNIILPIQPPPPLSLSPPPLLSSQPLPQLVSVSTQFYPLQQPQQTSSNIHHIPKKKSKPLITP